MDAERARKVAVDAARAADRAECHAWSLRMEGFGGPAQPSPTMLNAAAAKFAPAFPLMPSAARETPRYGNWNLPLNADHAGRHGTHHRFT
jgi:hypothetical protein